MDILNELRDLVEINGGSRANVNTISQAVEELQSHSGGGGGSVKLVKLSRVQSTATLGSTPLGSSGAYYYPVCINGYFGETYDSGMTLEEVIPNGNIIGFVAKNLAISSKSDGSDKTSIEESSTQPPLALGLFFIGASGMHNGSGDIRIKNLISSFDEIKDATTFSACGSLYISPWAQASSFNGKYLWCDVYAIVAG